MEEKSIEEAEKRRMNVLELTEKCSQVFFEDLKLLKIKPPTYNPRSSTSVDQAVSMIQYLLKKGHAYRYKGNVYFNPLKFRDFGKLGHLDKSRWPKVKKRYHKDTYHGNYWNLGDFILWYGYKKGDPVYWDTPLGRGRPAWNVQDPAMAVQTLGFSFDIYCGGEDNLVRHHDYTIAIAESVSGKTLAKYWLHGAHLLVDGKKMSKSKGNVIYPDDSLKSGYTDEEIRFFLIYNSYRKRLNFTYNRIAKTSQKLRNACEVIQNIQNTGAGRETGNEAVKKLTEQLRQDFLKNMDNDLDVKQAFDNLSRHLMQLDRLTKGKSFSLDDVREITAALKGMDNVLQVFRLSED